MVPQFRGNEIEASTNWRIETTVRAGWLLASSYWQSRTFSRLLGLGLATLRLNLLDQRSQHPLYRNYSLLRNLEIGFLQKSQVLREQQMIFGFASGTTGDLKEARHFAVRMPAASFRDVRSD